MIEQVAGIRGRKLGLEAYFADFEARFWGVDSSWKLERRQDFREPDVPSWAAMDRGDEDLAWRLADEMRHGIADHQRRLDAKGIVQRRVRVVATPLSDYLRWELHVLRIRAELGERIRVISPARLAAYETSGPVPELIVLGEQTVYQVLYDDDGVVTGAKRVAAPKIAKACRDDVATLWNQGEDLANFLARVKVDASGVT